MKAAAAVGLTLTLSGCAATAGDERAVPPRQTLGRESSICSPRTFTVTFDSREQVVVSANGRTLATATFEARTISAACRRVREPPLSEMGPASVVYARIAIRCTLPRAPNVVLHPVMGENDESVGNVLLISDRSEPAVSAVLKNRGDPQASRIYFASLYCERA